MAKCSMSLKDLFSVGFRVSIRRIMRLLCKCTMNVNTFSSASWHTNNGDPPTMLQCDAPCRGRLTKFSTNYRKCSN